LTIRSAVLVAPAPLDARTGGYIYNRRIAAGLGDAGWHVEMLALDPSFPHPTAAAIDHAARTLAAVPAGTVAIVDSLALGALGDVVRREASRLRIAALMHQPRGGAAEASALRGAALVVLTGTAALPAVQQQGVPLHRVVVVEPGTDRPTVPPRSARRGGPVQLLSVATINAGKGHEVLLRALASLRPDAWRLTCAGSLTRDAATAERVRHLPAALGVQDRVAFTGDLDAAALGALYAGADVFVLATRQETYGMAVAEALAYGLPVVATTTGAIPALVGHDAGVLVPVDDVDALAGALARVVEDEGLRERLAGAARRRRDQLPTWQDASRRFADALASLVAVDARG
jgi:glycosyltransferase involved in cell wall biosynthesis